MSVKISELPNLTVAQLITTGTTATWPLVANTGANNTTFQTTVANLKTYVETGNLNVTGSINGSLTSTLANLIITGNLNVQGTTTTTSSQNLSTNSSIIDLHTFNSNLSPWTSDDGRDIGLRFFWYKGSSAGTSALVWENSNSYLTWYGTGVSNANTGTISGTLGTMQLGQLLVANNTPSFANATGALQVSGGISTGGNVFVGEHVYAANDISAQGTGIFGNIRSNSNISIATTLTAAGSVTGQSLASNSFATIHTTLVTGGNTTVNGLAVNTSATISTTLGVIGAVTAAGGLQNTPIGNTTASTATFTTVRTGNVIPSAANVSTLGNSTTWYSAVYATAVQSYYADLAEKYIADQIYDPGTVVIFGGTEEITTTDKLGDTRVAGVISTDPAYLMNMSSTGLPVALRGKVPVKIVGQVSKGDLLVTGDTPGHGISVGFRTDYAPNAVFAKSLVDDRSHDARVIWAVIL
jgi:cytoskeletal protein CcmA (bactofilin family)